MRHAIYPYLKHLSSAGLPVRAFIHQAMGAIACQACSAPAQMDTSAQPETSGHVTSGHVSTSPDGPGQAPSSALTSSANRLNRSALLNDLSLKIEESRAAAASLVDEVFHAWTSGIRRDSRTFQNLQVFVADRLRVGILPEDNSVSGHERSLLQALLTAARFVLFLEGQEHHQTVFGQKAANLDSLKGRLQQVVCSARLLLSSVSDRSIQSVIDRNVQLSSLHTDRSSDALRRTVCGVVLRQMVTALGGISF
ncbi:hypothetical protein EGW08_008481 [Elysia chlorotica]|uniref:Uncharacterized protein n=1 Tax=Elysia chlorotica TaxID=188477 RepID=A0A3S1BHH9_ELYCH|nr:hypothetical protein EGW08_008481 [Elysia chlorotica]